MKSRLEHKCSKCGCIFIAYPQINPLCSLCLAEKGILKEQIDHHEMLKDEALEHALEHVMKIKDFKQELKNYEPQ